jgi:hypothetical protein
VDAFHSDPEAIAKMLSLSKIDRSLDRPKWYAEFELFIKKELPKYCTSHGLQLFAVFD